MAYQEFAYFYDEFNGAADYDALFAYVTGELKAHGIQDGIVADFGCGTGELTLMLAQAGYDMIGIDVSEEMLSVLRDKADALGLPLTNPMLLCQDLLQLDLYGTIRAAVSTFDTYNHIGPLENFEKAIAKAAFFMEKDGVFVFDLNTPYKHDNGSDRHGDEHDDGVGLGVLFGRPHDLLQLALRVAEELRNAVVEALHSGLHSGHKARLFLGFVCHDVVRLSYLVSR